MYYRKLAKKLRNNSTDVEKLLWKHLRLRQMRGYKFRRQHPIGKYIVDFICLETKLIVEIDGGQHDQQSELDKERTKYLENLGFKILRFWNNEILNDLVAVKNVIWGALIIDKFQLNLSPSRSKNLKEAGMILAVTLLFLLILSLLAVSALSTTHLQIRISNNLVDEVKLLEAAEAGLKMGEEKLIQGNYTTNFADMIVNYSIKLIDNNCVYDKNNKTTAGVIYQITSGASWIGKEQLTIQSTYTNAVPLPCLSNQRSVQIGRLSWRQL